MMFFYSIVMLLQDFVEAYVEDPYNIKKIYDAFYKVLHDIKFWLVFCIIASIGVILFGYILTESEKIRSSNIDAHVILSDGRHFYLKKSDIIQNGDCIQFTNGEETITTTLYTITYKEK